METSRREYFLVALATPSTHLTGIPCRRCCFSSLDDDWSTEYIRTRFVVSNRRKTTTDRCRSTVYTTRTSCLSGRVSRRNRMSTIEVEPQLLTEKKTDVHRYQRSCRIESMMVNAGRELEKNRVETRRVRPRTSTGDEIRGDCCTTVK
jgi:hypothetical protein